MCLWSAPLIFLPRLRDASAPPAPVTRRAYLASVTLARLPLFPLPLVLLPGATLPLHIFEPRYRQLLVDALSGTRRFGIVRRPEGVAEEDIPAGTIGSTARIDRHETLPDGRSNITVSGHERFSLARIVPTGAPYLVGEVTPHTDLPEPDSLLTELAGEARVLFERVAQAARAVADDASGAMALPAGPRELAFAIAAFVELDLDARQALLASRSAAQRLRDIVAVLEPAAPVLEGRAAVHLQARSNGHGPHTP